MPKYFNSYLSLLLLISLFSLLSVTVSAQQGNGNPCNASTTYLYWTGEEDNNFLMKTNRNIKLLIFYKNYGTTQRTTRNNEGPQWAIHAENFENL